MNPPTAEVGYVDSEKGLDSKALLAPPLPAPPGYQAVYQSPSSAIPQDRPRNDRRRRFWHFFACTFLLIGALHLLCKNGVRRRHGIYVAQEAADNGVQQCSDSVNWTTASDGPPGYRYYAYTSLTLPVSAEELYFIAEGSHSAGTFEVSHSADASSDAVVDVEVSYRYSEALDDASVCRLNPSEGKWGLGIFTPHWRHPHNERNRLIFHVHLYLPSSGSDAPLAINTLRTDLPQFAHHLHELADVVYFDHLRLRASNSHIQADSLTGNVYNIHSSNGRISGTFEASTTLELETSNAAIDARVSLVNGNEGPTQLYLKTSNGRIDSDVSLLSNTSDATNGTFAISARTSNAHLNLAFLDAPVDSTLVATAHTSNARADVTLHKTFEGAFDLTSSSFTRSSVEWDRGVEDPAGRGRERKVEFSTVKRGEVHGSAAWAEGGEKRGRVSVHTSNAPIQLVL